MLLRVAQYACRPSKRVLSRKFRYNINRVDVSIRPDIRGTGLGGISGTGVIGEADISLVGGVCHVWDKFVHVDNDKKGGVE